MKSSRLKKIIIIAAFVCVILLTGFITYNIAHVDPDKAMIESFLGCFGWHPAKEISISDKKLIQISYILLNQLKPVNLNGLQLGLEQDSSIYDDRIIGQCVVELEEKGLYDPLRAWVFIEEHKIIAVGIQCKEDEYYRDHGFYPVNSSHDEILEDLHRQQKIGPFQGLPAG